MYSHTLSKVFIITLVVAFMGRASEVSAQLHLRINVGGGDVRDSEGRVWHSDKGFARHGQPFVFPEEKSTEGVEGPAPAEVYRTVRHQDHSFGFPQVPNGSYLIRLHLLDGFPSRSRRMDFHAEGELRLGSVNPFEAAGDKVNQVIVREFPVTITEGQGLRMACLKGPGDDVFEAAIEIIEVAPLPAPEYTALDLEGVSGQDAGDQIRDEVLKLTEGRETRLVWVRSSDPGDFMVRNDATAALMGFGTGNGGGFEIVSGMGPIQKPLLSPDGTRVVFTTAQDNESYVVGWNGEGLRKLGFGFAADVWEDPETGIEWVYQKVSLNRDEARLVRRQLDAPEMEEEIWAKYPANGHIPWLQLSADGTRATEAFPWPKCGVAMLDRPDFEWDLFSNGCWPGMAPNNTGRFYIFEGNHESVSMFEPGDRNSHTVPVNSIPELNGGKVYHPRWSNHPRYLTVTGPQRSLETELYLGRFDEAYTHVEAWVRLTHNHQPDFYGDAWVEPRASDSLPEGPSLTRAGERRAAGAAANGPSVSEKGLIFQWVSSRSKNEVQLEGSDSKETCAGELRGGGAFGRHFDLDLREGWFEVTSSTDAWHERLTQTGEMTLAAVITPSALNQEGPARIISYSSGSAVRNFTLGQEGEQLIFRLRTSDTDLNGVRREVAFGQLEAGVPVVLVLRYQDGKLVASLNGEEAFRTNGVTGDFSNWTRQHLLFGDEWGGDRNWRGNLEDVLIYSRFLADEETAQIYHAVGSQLKERQRVPQVVVDAELIEATPLPDPSELDTYRRGLVANHYRVTQVHSGNAPEEFVALQWAVLDGQALSDLPVEGDVVRLVLEPEGDHPQLKSEWRKNTLSVFTLPSYYRVGP